MTDVEQTARDLYQHVQFEDDSKSESVERIAKALQAAEQRGAEKMQKAASEKALETAGKAAQDIMKLDPGDVLNHEEAD